MGHRARRGWGCRGDLIAVLGGVWGDCTAGTAETSQSTAQGGAQRACSVPACCVPTLCLLSLSPVKENSAGRAAKKMKSPEGNREEKKSEESSYGNRQLQGEERWELCRAQAEGCRAGDISKVSPEPPGATSCASTPGMQRPSVGRTARGHFVPSPGPSGCSGPQST